MDKNNYLVNQAITSALYKRFGGFAADVVAAIDQVSVLLYAIHVPAIFDNFTLGHLLTLDIFSCFYHLNVISSIL